VQFDDDGVLSVVQWSALTRVLRELVTNAIAHAQATRIDVTISLVNDRLDLQVCDDGVGRNPQAWSHGLGLGGVRKRVKQLGGEVQWRENPSRGITCAVHVADWSHRP
jgi:signal transduction histidine kinase